MIASTTVARWTWGREDEAFQRALSPSAALTEASSIPEEAGSGRVDPAARPRTVDLVELRELASRD